MHGIPLHNIQRISILYIGAWRWLYNKLKHVARIVRKYNKYRCVRWSVLDFINSVYVRGSLICMCSVSMKMNIEVTNECVSSHVSCEELCYWLHWFEFVHDCGLYQWNCQPLGLFVIMQVLIIFVTCQLFIMSVIILAVGYVDDSASCWSCCW